jgi:calcium-dependent protein kinase
VQEAAAGRMGAASVKARYHTLPERLEGDYIIDHKHVLGTGMNGGVYVAGRKGSSTKFAVKCFNLSTLGEEELMHIRNETEIFLSMDHPNVVRLVDVYESEDQLSFVMECMEGGELFDQVVNQKVFADDDAAAVALQMLRAVDYMHRSGVVHRDLKLENFLYQGCDSDTLKVIDFGFSKAWDRHCPPMQDHLGTPVYVAPEVLEGNYTSQCDLWSLGVIVFILLAGYMPFNKDEVHLIKKGQCHWKPRRWSKVSALGVDFVKKLLTVCPTQRLTASQALEHPWLARARATQERKQREQLEQSGAGASLSSCTSQGSSASSSSTSTSLRWRVMTCTERLLRRRKRTSRATKVAQYLAHADRKSRCHGQELEKASSIVALVSRVANDPKCASPRTVPPETIEYVV